MKNNGPNVIGAKASARKVIRRFGITQPNQICVEDIAMALGVFVYEASLNGAEARLVRKCNKGIIRVREGVSHGKRRFAISHELGHWERHENISQIFYCTSQDLADYNNSYLEIEANAFAGELLIPFTLLKNYVYENEPNFAAIRKLAKLFNTSLTVAAIRFVEESPEKCAIIFSENGRIKWWRKSKELFAPINTKVPINRGTYAWDCFNGTTSSTSMREVDKDVWFMPNAICEYTQLYEQSIKLGKYPVVLSLLWLTQD